MTKELEWILSVCAGTISGSLLIIAVSAAKLAFGSH